MNPDKNLDEGPLYRLVDAVKEPVDNLVYAGFWRRLLAYGLDFLILLPLTGIYFLGANQVANFHKYALIPNALFGLWFSVYLVTRYGGTPGKLIMNIRIASVDGSPVSYSQAFLRHFVLFALATAGAIGTVAGIENVGAEAFLKANFLERAELLIDRLPTWTEAVNVVTPIWIASEFLVLLFNRKRRALHDYMAGTVVMKSQYQANPNKGNVVSTTKVAFIVILSVLSMVLIIDNIKHANRDKLVESYNKLIKDIETRSEVLVLRAKSVTSQERRNKLKHTSSFDNIAAQINNIVKPVSIIPMEFRNSEVKVITQKEYQEARNYHGRLSGISIHLDIHERTLDSLIRQYSR